MSPLVVSQLLPPLAYFDVVIFDEASQITPADAVTSILRGRQLVVAGDDKQLPPTAFFVSDSTEDEPEQPDPDPDGAAPLLAGTAGFESILDALGSVLGFRMLTWHYRSHDERLIAFSNAHIYDRMLTTFPGIGESRVLSYVPVPWHPGAETNSPAPEADAVIDLIFQHARERPGESLGVITMGIRHRDQIEERRLQRLRQDPELAEELAEFFDESREERFFVKNLERVQGDERDAIILSIGYGKNARGDLPYRFGPLLTEGGERRLNVAVTRAKYRLTLVSSFSSRDMDPERSAAEGVKLVGLQQRPAFQDLLWRDPALRQPAVGQQHPEVPGVGLVGLGVPLAAAGGRGVGRPTCAATPAAASSAATYRHPVQPSIAKATSSRPANRVSQARRCARSAGEIWPRLTSPVMVSR
jgi:hypothetical protein